MLEFAFLQNAEISGWGGPMFDRRSDAGGVYHGEGLLLYGLVCALQPETIVEVGTGYGVGTAYLAAGCRDNGRGVIHTSEIVDGRWQKAALHLQGEGLMEYVVWQSGPSDVPHVDLAFLDAGHERKDVEEYINALDLHENSVIVIHDSGWKAHVKDIMEERGWWWVHLPQTSTAGIAICKPFAGAMLNAQ